MRGTIDFRLTYVCTGICMEFLSKCSVIDYLYLHVALETIFSSQDMGFFSEPGRNGTVFKGPSGIDDNQPRFTYRCLKCLYQRAICNNM